VSDDVDLTLVTLTFDAADAAFEQLWTSSDLTWDDLTRLSDDAAAVRT